MGQGQSIPDGTTAKQIKWDQGTAMAIAAFTAVAWYNVLELNTQVFLTFKRRRGLYFWSLIISSYGCVLHALGFLLKFFLTDISYLSVTIITIGWYAMVTGQAVVLYSRLHLVVREQRILSGIRAMIIIDAIVFHIPTTVLTYWSNATPNPRQELTDAFNVYEKLQMTAFCIQEFIISGVYVWATISLLRPVYHGRTRKVMTQLIWINLIIIAMDAVLLAMEYSNTYEIEATLKAMVYSIKLKLEFAVLNQLMTLANSSVNNHQNLHIDNDQERSDKSMPGRSKSTEYISNRYRKPKRRPNRPPGTTQGMQKSYSTSRMPDNRAHSFTPHHPNRFQWVPDLDKDTFLGELTPGEKQKKEAKKNSNIDVITNPAAYYGESRKKSPAGAYPAADGLADIEDSPVLSPTLTGTTLHTGQQQPRRGRRAAPPPNLDLDRAVMPSGLVRSSRPSVSDWAHGPESDESPSTDELRLEPYDSYATPLRSPGSVKAGREMANRSMADLNFMTSALKE